MTGYDGYKWGHNSPAMATSVFHENCAYNELVPLTVNLRCPALDLTILSTDHGYPINWMNLTVLFNPNRTEEVLRKVKDSNFVHIYSSASKSYNVTKSSKTAYSELVAKCCPQIFDSSDDVFAHAEKRALAP